MFKHVHIVLDDQELKRQIGVNTAANVWFVYVSLDKYSKIEYLLRQVNYFELHFNQNSRSFP